MIAASGYAPVPMRPAVSRIREALRLEADRGALALELNYRAWQIAYVNIPYLVFLIAALLATYHKRTFGRFLFPCGLVFLVITLGFIADRPEPPGGRKPVGSWIHKWIRENITPTETASFVLAFSRLLIMAVIDLVATGLLVNRTGGPVVSPFSQFAAIMIVLGAAMSTLPQTRALIVAAGTGYFWLIFHLAPAANLSGAASQSADDTIHLSQPTQRNLFLLVLLVNLTISAFITSHDDDDVTNPDDQTAPKPGDDPTDGPQDSTENGSQQS